LHKRISRSGQEKQLQCHIRSFLYSTIGLILESLKPIANHKPCRATVFPDARGRPDILAGAAKIENSCYPSIVKKARKSRKYDQHIGGKGGQNLHRLGCYIGSFCPP
jgi:hypothetical protein